MIQRKLAATAVLTTLALAPYAHAGDAATAEALFRDARAQMEAGDFASACPKLVESYAQDPATGTLLALAVCQEQTGQSASAWASYAEALARSKREGRQDREEAARTGMAGLESKLSRLTIVVDADTGKLPGLVVQRDGVNVGRGAWGTGVPIDPGDHVVEVTAVGKSPWKKTVTIGKDGDAQTLQVPLLEDAPAAPPTPEKEPKTSRALGPEGRAVSTQGASDGPPLRTIGLITGGVGIVGLGISGFFGLRARSLNDESNADGHCNARNQCDPTGGEKRDDAKSAATVATVGLIAGGVLTAAGVTLFFVGGPKSKEKTAHVEAAPAVGPGQAALYVRGRF